jgi:hypothetical protein
MTACTTERSASEVEKQERRAQQAAEDEKRAVEVMEQELAANDPQTYHDNTFVRAAELGNGEYVKYAITNGVVHKEGVGGLSAWIVLPSNYHGNYDQEVVKAVAEDVAHTFEGGKFATGGFEVVVESPKAKPISAKDTLKDWTRDADHWGRLTVVFREDGVAMSGPQEVGGWEFQETKTGEFISG